MGQDRVRDAVRDYTFDTIGLDRLVSLIRVGNVASRRVSEKVGMRLCRMLIRHGHEYALYAIERTPEQPALAREELSGLR